VYDQLGRLIRETHDNTDDNLDYSTFYKYDLVGNRLEKSYTIGHDVLAQNTTKLQKKYLSATESVFLSGAVAM